MTLSQGKKITNQNYLDTDTARDQHSLKQNESETWIENSIMKDRKLQSNHYFLP